MGSFQTCSTPAPSLQFQDLTDPKPSVDHQLRPLDLPSLRASSFEHLTSPSHGSRSENLVPVPGC